MRRGEFAAGRRPSLPASNATRVPQRPPEKSGFPPSSQWPRSVLRERSPTDRSRHLPAIPLGCSAALLANLKLEIAVGGMGVYREDVPIDAVSSCTAGAERYRHLIAADAGFAGIDALTGGVCHGDGAERRFQLFSKP